MGRFEHLSMVAFLILGLALVRLMTSYGALLARNITRNEIEAENDNRSKSKSKMLSTKLESLRKNKEDPPLSPVRFYWVHNMLIIMVFFTMIIFWWNAYPLNNTQFMPDSKWNLFLYLMFLLGPFILFLICDVILPFNRDEKDMDMKKYYYRHYKLIIGLSLLLQMSFLGNLVVFFQEDITSTICIGRIILIFLLSPLFFSKKEILHSIIMSIFFTGFIYTIVKYHIYA